MRLQIRLLILLLMVVAPQTTFAQIFSSRQSMSREFVPASAFAGAAVFPKKLAEYPAFDAFPHEIVTAWGKKEFGFDPMLINQITLLAKQFDTLDRPPLWAAVLNFDQMQGLGGGMINRMQESKLDGKVVFSGSDQGLPSFLIYDEATIFVGDEAFFPDLLNANKSGNLHQLIGSASVGGEFQLFVDVTSIRPVLNEALASLPAVLPPPIVKLKSVANLIESIEVGVKTDGRLKSTIVIHTAEPDQAQSLEKILAEALDFGKDMMIGMLAAQMDLDDPVQEATVEYTQRISSYFQEKWTPEVSGRDLTFQLDEEATVVPIAIGVLLPAFQQARASARRVTSMNNTRQMSLSLLNYESAHGHFPAQASYDADGKPLLSWRVHVLPFIEQSELYAQFHLDEPWDSPHNKKLISKMPATYRSPSVDYHGDGKTVYLGISGEGMIFDGNSEHNFSDIKDGSSNTVLLVEANEEFAVPWTKPEDYEVDRNQPLKGLGNIYEGGFIVTMTDASSHMVNSHMAPSAWLKMLTIDGQEDIRDNK